MKKLLLGILTMLFCIAPWYKISGTNISKHIWEVELDTAFQLPGVYYIHVKSKDKWFEHEVKILIYVK